MKVFVTGAAGFVGTNLVSTLLTKGYEVSAWTHRQESSLNQQNERLKVFYGDLSDTSQESYKKIEKAIEGSQIIIHLAAKTSQAPSTAGLCEQVNVDATAKLIEICKKYSVKKFIFLSTQSAKISRPSHYGASKKKAEDLLLQSHIDTVIFRPAIIYGGGNAGIFKKFVNIIQKFPVVPIPSTSVTFQPVFIDDVVQSIVRAIEVNQFSTRIYDIAGATSVTFPELIRMVAHSLHLKRIIIPVPMNLALLGAVLLSKILAKPSVTVDNLIGLTEVTPINLDPLKKDLGINPVSLQEGLQKTFSSN